MYPLSSLFSSQNLRRTAQAAAFFSLTAGALVAFSTGCDLLPGTDDAVQCNLTGTVVGVDGGIPKQIDVAWYPDTELASSVEILEVETNGNSFEVLSLKISAEDQRVQGELRVDEVPVGIDPKKYDPVFIAIDLPRDACNEDFGTIELPLFGTANTNNGTSGTNNATSTGGTSGTNNDTSGTNNGTSGTSGTSTSSETSENNATSTGGETSDNNGTSTSGNNDTSGTGGE